MCGGREGGMSRTLDYLSIEEREKEVIFGLKRSSECACVYENKGYVPVCVWESV